MRDKQRVTIASSAAGAVANIFTKTFSGNLEAIYLELGDLASGAVDFVITEAETGAPILTITNASASGWYKPMIPVYGTDGTALLHAAGGTAEMGALPIDGQIKIVTTGAGNSHTGYLTFYIA